MHYTRVAKLAPLSHPLAPPPRVSSPPHPSSPPPLLHLPSPHLPPLLLVVGHQCSHVVREGVLRHPPQLTLGRVARGKEVEGPACMGGLVGRLGRGTGRGPFTPACRSRRRSGGSCTHGWIGRVLGWVGAGGGHPCLARSLVSVLSLETMKSIAQPLEVPRQQSPPPCCHAPT